MQHRLAGTAQAFVWTGRNGGTTALLTIVSGWLFAQFGAGAFWAMAFLCGASLPIICELAIRHFDKWQRLENEKGNLCLPDVAIWAQSGQASRAQECPLL